MAAEDNNNNIPAALMQSFLQRYPRNFVFYSPCMDFFKQSFGPIVDLTINALNQRDLIYSLTLDLPNTPTLPASSWQLSICVNCNTVLCAKRVHANQSQQQQYLINSALLTTNEEVAHRRTDKSFSEAFGVLIMDHPALKNPTTTTPSPVSSSVSSSVQTNFTVGSATTSSTASNGIAATAADCKQQRLRQFQHNLQQRVKREIAETDERIQRYTEQQFALLKSFREKSEQEYQLLVRLIQQVPEQHSNGSVDCWLDRSPPALEVNGAAPLSYASRRRNTINSRRDLNTAGAASAAPTTPTTTSAPIFAPAANPTSSSSSFVASAPADGDARAANSSSVGMLTSANAAQRKLTNFDTPPATPEATPMSVGNSPTFKQQQPQPQQQPPQSFGGGNNARLLATQMSFQQQFPTPTAETSDDCIFELEGVETANNAPITGIPLPAAAAILSLQQQHFQRTLNSHQQHHHHHHLMQQQQQQREGGNTHHMSDLDESDDGDAEEAEDALDMENSAPIAMKHVSGLRINHSNNNNNNNNNNTSAQMPNFAKSLPIDISNSPLYERNVARATNPTLDVDEEDELDNTVDIAASIKALAKSVHGEAVFGDLPRPRLRSQI